jgi:hypothetical protein
MSDPRYQDPLIDPRRPSVRDPAKPAEPQRIELEDDAGRGTIWGWIVGHRRINRRGDAGI